MTEEIYHPGVEVKRNGQILTLSEKARMMLSDTTSVTITVDATSLSRLTILEFLNVAEDAFVTIRPKANQHIDIVINDSTPESAAFVSAVLKTQVSPLLKAILAKSGFLAVKYFGLALALDLLAEKVEEWEDAELDYKSSLTVDSPECHLFLLPGVTLGEEIALGGQVITQEDVEAIFGIEDIVRTVSFVAEKDSSVTLDEYLSSYPSGVEIAPSSVYGSSVRVLSRLLQKYQKAIGGLTSNQLRDLIDLVRHCDLDSYPIEMFATRIKLPRVATGYHPELVIDYQTAVDFKPTLCSKHLIPSLTLDEMDRLRSEAKNLNFDLEDSKIFSTHLHSPVDFLLTEVGVRKGLSRYAEMYNFISIARGPIPDWEKYSPTDYFNKQLDKYLMEMAMEVLRDDNDHLPIPWLAEIHQHHLTEPPPHKYSSS